MYRWSNNSCFPNASAFISNCAPHSKHLLTSSSSPTKRFGLTSSKKLSTEPSPLSFAFLSNESNSISPLSLFNSCSAKSNPSIVYWLCCCFSGFPKSSFPTPVKSGSLKSGSSSLAFDSISGFCLSISFLNLSSSSKNGVLKVSNFASGFNASSFAFASILANELSIIFIWFWSA